MEEQEVKKRLCEALDELVREDAKLFEADATEKAITSRLAVYLEPKFPELDVDCEYNRDMKETKRVELQDGLAKIMPDIIVHERLSGARNILALEAKKRNHPDLDKKIAVDRDKLLAMRKKFGYQHLVLVLFNAPEKPPYVVTFV